MTSDKPKVQLHFALSNTGLVELINAEAEVTVISLVEIRPPTPNATANLTTESETAGESDSDDDDDDDDDDKQEKKAKKEETEEKPKQYKEVKNVHRIALKSTKEGLCIRDRNEKEIAASKAKLDALDARDKAHKDKAEARNNLEEFVFRTRELLSDETARKELEPFANEGDLERLQENVAAMLEWLDEESEGATTEELRSRLATLRAPLDAAMRRMEEAKLRPRAMAMLLLSTNFTRQAIANTTKTREISDSDVERLSNQCDEIDAWVEAKMAEQSSRKPNEDPAFWVEEVDTRVEDLTQTLKWLATRPTKKPPTPQPPPSTNETETVAANEEKQQSEEELEEAEEEEIPERAPKDEL
jgi:hypoxia up-regulated 1